jgi:hypothetical protein
MLLCRNFLVSECDELISTFAFNCNLHRYKPGGEKVILAAVEFNPAHPEQVNAFSKVGSDQIGWEFL